MSTNDHAPVRPEAPSHETEDTMPELTLLRKTRRVEAAIAQAAPVFERAGMGRQFRIINHALYGTDLQPGDLDDLTDTAATEMEN